MNNRKRKKIWYIPGIISLIVLIFPFSAYVKRELSTRYCIKLLIADTLHMAKDSKDEEEGLHTFRNVELPQRNYTDIVLTGNRSHDQVKLAFAQVRIREIQSSDDSINGLHFVFTDSSKYWEFIQTINILRIEGAKRYIPHDNSIWFYHVPPSPPTEGLDIVYQCGGVIMIEPQKTTWMIIEEATNGIWKNSWQIIVLFTTFIVSLFIIKKRRSRPIVNNSYY